MIGLCGYGKIGKLLFQKLEKDYQIKIVKSEDDLTEIKTLIDFSDKSAKGIILAALNKGINVIMGTTGYSKEEIQFFNQKALESNTIFYSSSNFSLCMPLFLKMLESLKKMDVSLIEAHDISKSDCPSGTAIRIMNALHIDMENVLSIRKKGVPATHIVIHETDGEMITVMHQAKSKEAYIEGFIEYFKRLVSEYDQRII